MTSAAMWLLSAEQAGRLVHLQRERDLERIGEALGAALPAARTRAGERWGELVAHGAACASSHGFVHMVCIARFIACQLACGSDVDSREPWAAQILADTRRGEGVRIYQLCVRAIEHLRGASRDGGAAAALLADAVRRLDDALAGAGALGSLLPRERIRLGAACDVDAVELRLVDADWRQHYTAQGGPWRRERCAPADAALTLVHDAAADAAPRWPEQVTLLSHPPGGDASSPAHARLRVRVKAAHRCDGRLHPALQWQDDAGARVRRGDAASDVTFDVLAAATEGAAADASIGAEDSPRFSRLSLTSCGLREQGAPVGELSTLLAAYDASQHLVAFRREAPAPWQLPGEPAASAGATRCRREVDGVLADSSSWQRGFDDLDRQLARGLTRLLTGWERESGVADGKLAADAALLSGSAGVTWGWAEQPEGLGVPPYRRVEALLDLVACKLDLRFTGALLRSGTRSFLELTTVGNATLHKHWLRAPGEALFAAAAELQVAVRQRFALAVRPIADAGLALLSSGGEVEGALTGAFGLEPRPDGPGLRWFARLKVEPIVAPLRIVDPLLGVHALRQPLLPAQAIVDWSLA